MAGAKWSERHPTVNAWAVFAATAVATAVAAYFFCTTIRVLNSDDHSRWGSCSDSSVTTTVTQPSPASAKTTVVNRHTCSPATITGKALVPAVAGLLFLLPLVRFLARDVDLAVGPLSVGGKRGSDVEADQILERQQAAQSQWALLSKLDTLAGKVDELSKSVESLRKRRHRS